MGFDGAETFSGKKKIGVQARLKKNSPHAIFVHCHLLQLACIQAANHTEGIKHVYITLITLWKFFHYSPKRSAKLKEVQGVPELKIVKPSDNRWLAHERYVKAVKENYAATVITLENIYEQSHEPEALGICKSLSKESTLSAIFLLDFVLPLVIKLRKYLHREACLSIISSLVHATLHTIDEALLPAANWVLVMDAREEIERASGVKVTSANIASFQERVAKHFITNLKNNIVCRFTSQDVVSSFSIFNPEKMPPLGTQLIYLGMGKIVSTLS